MKIFSFFGLKTKKMVNGWHTFQNVFSPDLISVHMEIIEGREILKTVDESMTANP